MTNAILTTKISPSYKDVPEERYHFPSTYLKQIERALADFVIYYEPRRATAELSSRGGRQAYFAIARVVKIIEDALLPGHFYALVDNYLDFDQVVPFSIGSKYFESSLVKVDGTTNKGMFGRAVRNIPVAEFEDILEAGFASYLASPPISKEPWLEKVGKAFVVTEPAMDYLRPLVEVTASRPFRDIQFRHKVREIYDCRCAVTGLRLINGGGRPEVEAAHIVAVEDNGPDSIRNGLALSGTVHWMFDRGLISVDSDYKLLVANDAVPDTLRPLVAHGRPILLPKEEQNWPHQFFLGHHRENRFKG